MWRLFLLERRLDKGWATGIERIVVSMGFSTASASSPPAAAVVLTLASEEEVSA
jgi:hypothetical protein